MSVFCTRILLLVVGDSVVIITATICYRPSTVAATLDSLCTLTAEDVSVCRVNNDCSVMLVVVSLITL